MPFSHQNTVMNDDVTAANIHTHTKQTITAYICIMIICTHACMGINQG